MRVGQTFLTLLDLQKICVTFISLNKFIMIVYSTIYLIILIIYYKYYYFLIYNWSKFKKLTSREAKMTSILRQREYVRIADGMHAASTRVYVRASMYSLHPIIGALLEFKFFSKINASIRQRNSICRFLPPLSPKCNNCIFSRSILVLSHQHCCLRRVLEVHFFLGPV
jgi:hypothetical protein